MLGRFIHYLTLASVAIAFLTSCSGSGEPAESPARARDQQLKIYYLWTTEGDPHQHSSLKSGIKKALDDKILEPLLGNVSLEPLPDPVTRDQAIALARKLRSSPDTLAVVGPTYSGTTWATLPIFADAGIPVMVPSATSPYLFFQHREFDEPNLDIARTGASDEERCEEPDCYFVRPGTNESVGRLQNAFRLVPADVPDQVSAIQLTIRMLERLHPSSQKPPQVMLICDHTAHNGAAIYSRPMCDYLARYTSHRDLIAGRETPADYRIVSSKNIDMDHGDLGGLVTAIRATNPNYIVLVGYTELAWPVLQGLKERDESDPKTRGHKRQFIMSDGAFSDDTPDDLRESAIIYFTHFSHPHHDTCEAQRSMPARANSRESTQSVVAKPVGETAEPFAYDAVLILARGVKHCGDHLDRACLVDFLTHQQNLTGHYEHYDFHLGERQHAAYYVYNEQKRRKGDPLQPEWYANREDDSLRPYSDECLGPPISWE